MEQFWAKVEKTDGCWLWRGVVTASGYGRLSFDGRRVRAHRLVWESTFGPIPDGLNVCHRCDVRLCVNPAHLFLGTQADNVQDMRTKGRERHLSGEAHGFAKLNNEDALAIKRLYAAGGVTQFELGVRFGISRAQVGRITRREQRR